MEALRQALVDSDDKALGKLISEEVTYGHSDGLTEGKTAFIEAIRSGKYDFVSIRISSQSINTIGKTGIVRHLFDADTNDNNIPGQVNLSILYVWRLEKGRWRMVARQAGRVAM